VDPGRKSPRVIRLSAAGRSRQKLLDLSHRIETIARPCGNGKMRLFGKSAHSTVTLAGHFPPTLPRVANIRHIGPAARHTIRLAATAGLRPAATESRGLRCNAAECEFATAVMLTLSPARARKNWQSAVRDRSHSLPGCRLAAFTCPQR